MASIKDNIPAIKNPIVKELHAQSRARSDENVGTGIFNERLVQDCPDFAKSDGGRQTPSIIKLCARVPEDANILN